MNKSILNSIMGTLDRCPYVPRSKMIITEGTALALQAGASALGNVLGFGSAQSANKTNLQIARENNLAQREMFHEQMAYNTDMWNKQNQYNLPVNQVQRLLAAGINPSAVFGSGSMSEAGQLTAPNAPNLQQAHVSPYEFDLTGVSQAINAYYQNQLINEQKKKTAAETKNVEFMTLEANKKLLPSLELLRNQAKKEGVLGDLARQQLEYANRSFDLNIRQLNNDIRAQDDQHRIAQHQMDNMMLQNALMEIQVAYAPRLNESQLRQYYATVNQIKAQIGLINANTSLTNEQRKHEIEKKVGTIIQNGMSGLDFENKKATQDAMIDIIMNQADQQYYDAGNAAKFFYGGEAGRRLPLHDWMDTGLYNRRVIYHQRPYQGR